MSESVGCDECDGIVDDGTEVNIPDKVLCTECYFYMFTIGEIEE